MGRTRPARPLGRAAGRGRWPGAAHPRPRRARRPATHDHLDGGRRRRSVRRAHPVARRRAAGPAGRRDPARQVRAARAGDHRPGRLRQGAAHRAGRVGDRRPGRPAGRSEGVDRRLHQPGGHRHPCPARRRPPRPRPVQCRDRVPAADRSPAGRRGRPGPPRPRRPESSVLDPAGARGRRRPVARAARLAGRTRRAGRGDRPARRAAADGAGHPLLLPALLLLHRRSGPRPADRNPSRRRGARDRAHPARDVPRSRRSTTSPSCSRSAAAPTTARRLPRWSPRC